MRKETYLCDACGVEFGSMSHINIKNAQGYLSYLNNVGEWRQVALNAKCREYHFCNCQCLAEWMNPKVKEAIDKTKPKEVK